jgi:carbon-monoxide dehydrogenase catalytic subunit
MGLDILNKVEDGASAKMLVKAELDCVETCFDRAEHQKTHCKFGTEGTCCRICHMGPCRITPKAPKGICGATADTIVARNFLREVSAGTSAHSDHARHLVLKLKGVGKGEAPGYDIKDEEALRATAKLYELEGYDTKEKYELALELANLFLGEFSAQEEYLKTLNLAPKKRRAIWEAKGVKPNGIDRMVVEAMHRTSIGVDHEVSNLLGHVLKTALANGWGGSRIASMVSDILFGTSKPLTSSANLGVLKKETVNIVIHGHEPALSEILVVAAADPEVKAYAKAAGAEGITLAGICCTANEILMKHGVPLAGNFLQQELAVITGACEMMVMDVQCCFPSLPELAAKYHTEIVSTADIGKMKGAYHHEFDAKDPVKSGKELVKRAIDNYKNRDGAKINIPPEKEPLVAGFSIRAIKHILGGKYRASFRPLNDAIIQNRILGVVGMVGCNTTKYKTDGYMNVLTKELIKRNVLLIQSGCVAIGSAKAGFLKPEMMELAGDGLREICETVGIPPILHFGSCVNNSRILEACMEVLNEGGLGDDISMLPVAGVAPEWMSEKAQSIGSYFVASGVNVILGNPLYVSGGEAVNDYLHGGIENDFGAKFHYIPDPLEAADRIIELLNKKREALGINKKAERKLLDMKDRREL